MFKWIKSPWIPHPTPLPQFRGFISLKPGDNASFQLRAVDRRDHHAQSLFRDSTGVQEYRSTGVQEYRSTGIQEYKSTEAEEYRSTGVQQHNSTTVKQYNSTRLQYRSTGVQD